MPGKVLLIGVTLIILVLGVIGAAFATGMDFSNVGVLSSGQTELAQVNTDHIGFLSNADGIDRVALSFDGDLTVGSTIWVTVNDEVCGWEVLSSFLHEEDEVIIALDQTLEIEDFGQSYNVKVAVAER